MLAGASSLVWAQAAIEDQLRRFNDVLVNAARTRAAAALAQVEDFVNKGVDSLCTKPQSVREISEAKRASAQLAQQRADYRAALAQCQEHNKLLISVCTYAGAVGVACTTRRLHVSWNTSPSPPLHFPHSPPPLPPSSLALKLPLFQQHWG